MFGKQRRKIERLDFILAGAQKSGTTALHYFLSKHPDITMGDQQEIHFFDSDEFFAGTVDYDLLHRHFPRVARSTIAGECTPSYLYWKPAAERIWQYNPKIKLLVLLRNPIDRAFAHWNMQRFKGREPLDFLEAVKEEKIRIGGAPPIEARRFAYVDRGLYAQQLGRFFQFFPREQVKVMKFENFQTHQRETLDSIFSFLGLKPLAAVRSRDRNVVPYERAMNWEEKVFLFNNFASDIATLEQLLGWDCSDWKL
ncbi:MAG TPA: sulfotransferase domain-containing protein [Chthoniobacterales bacterium]|nr:sulfotransferase domain-containing protein [Chthoniobacterales bacterium]